MPYYAQAPKVDRQQYLPPWYKRPVYIWSIVIAITVIGGTALGVYILWPRTSEDISVQVAEAKADVTEEKTGTSWTWDTSKAEFIIEDQAFVEYPGGAKNEYFYRFVVTSAKSLGLRVMVVDFFKASRKVHTEQITTYIKEGRNTLEGTVKLKEPADRMEVRR